MKNILISALLGLCGLFIGITAPLKQHHALLIPAAYCDDKSDRDNEIKVGKQAEDELAKTTKFVTDPDQNTRVQGIVAKLAQVADSVQVPAKFGNDRVFKFDYHVKIIDAKDINAFSLPGGGIYIYKGLLDLLQGDDELAGVLGHEMAHAAHHHVMQLTKEENKIDTQTTLGLLVLVLSKVPSDQIGGLAAGLEYAQLARLNNHFSEMAEEDADHTGMVFMIKAGYNPLGMLSLLQRLQNAEDRSPSVDLGFLQDHPLTVDRIAAAKEEATELGYKVDHAQLWMVSNSMRCRVTDVGTGDKKALKFTFGSRQIALLSPVHKAEADAAATILDQFVADTKPAYRISSSGASVLVMGQPIFIFDESDCAVSPVKTTPEEMATAANAVIADALWEISVKGIDAQ